MYVEDLIIAFDTSPTSYKVEEADRTFIGSIAYQVREKKTLTSRQAFAIRKVLRKFAPDVSKFLPAMPKDEYLRCLDGNLWRNEPRITVQKRTEARYLGDNLVGFTYQYKNEIAQDALALRATWRGGVQIVSVSIRNLESLIHFLGVHRFEIDTNLEEYLALCLASKKQQSHFITNGDGAVFNICDSETLSNFVLHVLGGERI